jgi:antitoxin component YwqK of YwqJK toxin-antitoxin module
MKKLSTIYFSFILLSCSPKIEVRKEYNDSGQLMQETTYSNNLKDGKYTVYHENGQIALKGFYKDGYSNGEWIVYYSNGNLQSITTYNMEKIVNTNYWNIEGEHLIIDGSGGITFYDSLGRKESKVSYKDCKSHGEWILWHENGNMFSQGFFNEGKKVGKWYNWNIDGSLNRLMIYDDKGNLIEDKQFE